MLSDSNANFIVTVDSEIQKEENDVFVIYTVCSNVSF